MISSPASATQPTLDQPTIGQAHQAYARAVKHLQQIQQISGAWEGEVVWNTMLICQYVMMSYIIGNEIAPDRQKRILLALELQVNPDGGFGMHPESGSWLFHTTLAYVALRLLDIPPSHPLAKRSLDWINQRQGVFTLPTWGRIWLAMLGLYPWAHIQAILPELWLLPEFSPMHPRRLYCHMRLIYLGLSTVYGMQLTAPLDAKLKAIRDELYPDGGFRSENFKKHRDNISKTDIVEAPNAAVQSAFRVLGIIGDKIPQRIRKRSIERAIENILFEFRSTDNVCLSPVNGMLFCLALYSYRADHPQLAAAIRGIEYWVWEDDQEGLRIAGARSAIWDTSFMLQALCEGPSTGDSNRMIQSAARWLASCQIHREIVDGKKYFRSPAYGGWGFANEFHPWPVSDCTAEALEALFAAEDFEPSDTSATSIENQISALRFILDRANDDGGFGSYESRRGNMILRKFNPAEIYGNCMLEYSYVECTASCLKAIGQAHRRLAQHLPQSLVEEINQIMDKGTKFLLRQQHANGAWPGFWGINFCYGTFFAVAGLRAANFSNEHPAIRRAIQWLLSRQRPDGGWGESYLGTLREQEVPIDDHKDSSVAQTAWALLTLLDVAPQQAATAISAGMDYLCSKQTPSGNWPSEPATGVFFNSAVLDYRLYRQIFPTWVLARYLDRTTRTLNSTDLSTATH